jgi:hypothetical protein
MKPIEKYLELKAACEERIRSLKKQVVQLSLARTFVFLTGASGVYYFWKAPFSAWLIFICFTALFLVLVRRHAGKKELLAVEKAYLEICSEEIKISDGHWRNQPDGAGLIQDGHPYASDLNLFGKHSLFQYINRTQTKAASKILAAWLQTNITDTPSITDERENVAFFAKDPDWTFRYLSHARMLPGEGSDMEALHHWNSNLTFNRTTPAWLILTRLLPALMVGVVVAYTVGFIGWNAFLLCLLLPGSITVGALRKHQKGFAIFLDLFSNVSASEGMLEMLRSRDLGSVPFAEKVDAAKLSQSAEAIASLRKIVGAIESRNNVFVSIALNLIFLWDFQCARRVEKWKAAYGDALSDWLTLLRETEAMLSFSTYHFNHPNHVHAEMASDGTFTMTGARHPLMDASAVSNDLSLTDPARFNIITGANMAGKSTWLRTVGLNLVLAMRGLPVPVQSMRFTPVQIYTSMLATDSLGDNESYFFSELKRLRQMTDALETGKAHFVILDEILKGTNSIDKAEGSKRFMQKLLSLPAKGLIATHDLSLCDLAEVYPGQVINQRFEVSFEGDELVFDYTLREGVCENMNASFLLRKMGLVID